MIKSKTELKEILAEEKKLYIDSRLSKRVEMFLVSSRKRFVYKYVKYLRITEYHHNNPSLMHKLLYLYYRRKKNILGLKLGIEMSDNTFDRGLMIFHPGNIVVNAHSKIGKNFMLHGSNCVGNKGKGDDTICPVIGDNVRLGVGAKVIGDVYLANNISVAAGAVVVKSCYEEGAVLAGVPAMVIKHSDNSNE